MPDTWIQDTKRLIVCFDGTWNNADREGGETNVSRLARSIHASRQTGGRLQIVLYLRGVGSTGLDIQRIFQGITGEGMDDNIRSAYLFIAQNYIPGDEIFLFGFSRGAFSARSLVGMLNKAGLLKRESLGRLPLSWKFYRRDEPGLNPSVFVEQNPGIEIHENLKVRFLGVWDTVGSLGVPGTSCLKLARKNYGFYNTGPCAIVQTACHALAIDEARRTFVPTLWTGTIPDGCTIEQVWFAGAHSDVGGGYDQRTLADIPLLWMAEKAAAAGLAIDWTTPGVFPVSPETSPLAPRHDSRKGIFALSRFLPALRRIGEVDIILPFFRSLRTKIYIPRDNRGLPEKTINESVHESALSRYGASSSVFLDEKAGTEIPEIYTPGNLAAYVNQISKTAARATFPPEVSPATVTPSANEPTWV